MSGLAWHDMGGSGPTFVLVHGYTGSSEDFRSVIEPLRSVRRIVLVDQLGHGDSPRAARYTFDGLSRSVIEFLLTEIGEPVDILGHSMGGRTVLPIAVHHGQLVRSLVLMDTWGDNPDRDERSAELESLFAQSDDAVATALESGALDVGHNPEHELHVDEWSEEWVDQRLAHNSDRLDPRARVQLGRLVFCEGPSVLAEASRISAPTTVLVGEFDDPFIGPSQRLTDQIPNARQVVIPGAYHSPQLSHPTVWAEALLDHLAIVDAG
ncbi:MAG: alpha/beta hydrolase [Acidimicrobiia bacterium]|nr:alpha/beta hydrolase [Acidimicrobiia bacterium]